MKWVINMGLDIYFYKAKIRKAEDKTIKLKPIYKKDKVSMNYDITIGILGLGIIIMLGVMFFIR